MISIFFNSLPRASLEFFTNATQWHLLLRKQVAKQSLENQMYSTLNPRESMKDAVSFAVPLTMSLKLRTSTRATNNEFFWILLNFCFLFILSYSRVYDDDLHICLIKYYLIFYSLLLLFLVFKITYFDIII